MIIDIIGWEIGEAPRARQEGTHEDKGRAHSQTAQTHYMNTGRDSCLRAVLCYKRLFTKACMGSIGFS